MNLSVKDLIQKCEESLKDAMLQSSVSELDKLLADDLIFTNHLGHTMTKQDDLEAHKSKVLKINKITLSDMKIKTYTSIAIVTVKAHIIGSFNGENSENDFRFTRVWNKTSKETWQITVGHSSVVV
ncbi:hypothetical protein MNBD_GAMMA15-1276 [hydrothermal vent metagenome]|uniref:DUF4440 domain-containing protein n=1 Tax=hydrothermal vent metagenome TaxID=652676 RepID=A0A3B0YVP5_9ZZZZ